MSPNPDTMEVQMQRSYHLNDEDDTEVDKENVAQGIEWNYMTKKACEQCSVTYITILTFNYLFKNFCILINLPPAAN